jgi:hypothetical protein
MSTRLISVLLMGEAIGELPSISQRDIAAAIAVQATKPAGACCGKERQAEPADV